MWRVMVGLLGMAAGFAVLAAELELGRSNGSGWVAAFGVFAGLVVLGYPVLYLCCKRRWWAFWQTTLMGVVAGVFCTLPFIGGKFSFGFLMLIFVLAGAGFGMLFWLMAIWRNDGLTCPKSFCLPCGTVYRVARSRINR